MSDLDDDRAIAILCQRVADVFPRRPITPSGIVHCRDCDAAVWAAESSQEVKAARSLAFYVCLECSRNLPPADGYATSAKQDEELAPHGLTGEQVCQSVFGVKPRRLV